MNLCISCKHIFDYILRNQDIKILRTLIGNIPYFILVFRLYPDDVVWLFV